MLGAGPQNSKSEKLGGAVRKYGVRLRAYAAYLKPVMLALYHFAAAIVLPERAQLFSPEEIGWLREEAISAARAGRALAGLHRSDPFGRLARHPRIAARVRAALGEDIAIAASALAP